MRASNGLAAALALTMLACATRAPARAQEAQLKATTHLPPTLAMVKALAQWADDLKAKSNGRLVITIFAGGQMGPPPRQFDLVRTGVADIGIILHGSTPGRFPLVELSHLPGVVKDNYTGALGLSEIAQEVFGPDNPGVKVLNVFPIKTVIISRSEITSAGGLKGKRIRAAGSVQSDVLEALDAVPTVVQPGDFNDALSKGMIEGVSVGYSGIEGYKLDDVAKFIAEGDMGAITFSVVMNQGAYDKLAPDLRKLIDENSGLALGRLFGRIVADDEVHAKTAMQKRGLTVKQLSDEALLLQASDKIRDQAFKKAAAKGLDGRAALERMQAAIARHENER